jgi:hypothetical protein
MTKLIIVSASSKINAEPATPVPALQRFNGGFVKQIKKYYDLLHNVDVMILSPVYGLIVADAKIVGKEPLQGSWRRLVLSESDFARLRESSFETLHTVLEKKEYDEIYINLGKELLRVIEGFELALPSTTKVTYAQGSGMGPKMTHMRDWLKANIKI